MSGNELHRAASPYLQQHRDNPVAWKEWNTETLARARAEGKPILLSVGYAACHWCHVMAHESFEDAATAAVMNELFTNIKVDREERPDVDHLYMSALQALGQRGGWPLTMFLTPAAEPFWGGTYFPKEARYGRPGFTTVLRAVAKAFDEQPETIRANTTALSAALLQATAFSAGAGTADTAPSRGDLDRIGRRAASLMDPDWGGIRGAPKFPNAGLIELLIRAGRRLRDPSITALALTTLRHMAQGGIYDHLGGGFARYSVDERWLAPHFEKMLYDNGQLIESLAVAYRITGEALFKTRIAETIGWLEREMVVQDAYAASLDADSDGGEGKFYVWDKAEIEALVGPADAALLGRHYDVTDDGNWQDDHGGPRASILNRLEAPEPTPAEARQLQDLRRTLLAAREQRIRPGRDDKILTDWNGLTIQALARAAHLCGESAWLGLAEARFAGVLRAMADPDDQSRLIHARRGQVAGPGAFATDLAAMAAAALALHEATLAEADRPDYLGLARAWLERLERDHAGPDGLLFMAAEGTADLPLRLAPLADEATPNANGTAAGAMLRLAAICAESTWRRRAYRLLENAWPQVLQNPLGHCSLLNALDFALEASEIVLAGTDVAALRVAAQSLPHWWRSLGSAEAMAASPVRQAHIAAAGSGAAFLCRGESCSPPICDASALEQAFLPVSASVSMHHL